VSTVAIIQARLGSTRLPGKVLADVCGEPMIARQMARMSRARMLHGIVVAIPDGPKDDYLAGVCLDYGWALYRGSEQDVLSRYLGAAEAAEADIVVRVTADCPLIDPRVLDATVTMHLGMPLDFTANNLIPTWPHGLDVEVMSRATLAMAAAKATTAYDREHVTPWITRASAGGAIFRLGNLPAPAEGLSGYRLTVDWPADLAVVREIVRHFNPGTPSYVDVLRFLDSRPDLRALNARYERPHAVMGQA
jgi:spore coat polysaccharide biosynthesis protein SpsF (cytidylyltransferase family)